MINYDRCREIIIILNNYFKSKNDIAEIEYPKEINIYSNEYFIYMFYSCLLDYGMRSKLYHSNLVKTYKMHSEIFNPSYVIKMSEDKLRDIIVNNIHPRYPNIAFKKWLSLSFELAKYDDLVGYIQSIKSYKDLEKFIKNIKGYGQKTGGLLLRIIYDSGICKFSELDSIPIDRHDMEISYLVGITDNIKLTSSEIKLLSDSYVSICKELKINPSDIDQYLWEIGNTFCNRRDCINCPLKNYCIKD